MKQLTTLLIILLTVPAQANFPIRQSQTWQVGEDKIYVSENNETKWAIDHSCDKVVDKDAKVDIVFNHAANFFAQSRVKKDTRFQLIVNGNAQMCEIEKVNYLL